MSNKIQWIIVHHTAVSHKTNPDQWKATNDYHKKKWNSISSLGFYGGYNYEINADGIVKQFREDGERTIAQYDEKMVISPPVDLNDGRVISICLDGNFDIEEPTLQQCTSLYRLINEKTFHYPIIPAQIVPHRYFQNKTCWGSKLPDDILKYMKSRLGEEELSEWQQNAIDWAVKNMVSTGERPLESITRVEAMELIRKYHENVGQSLTS